MRVYRTTINQSTILNASSITVVGTKDTIDPSLPVVVLSTGGAAGLWQASVIEGVINTSNIIERRVQWLGGSAGAVNTWLISRYVRQAKCLAIAMASKTGTSDFTPDQALRQLIADHPLTSVWEEVIYPFISKYSKTGNITRFIFNRGYIHKTEKLYKQVFKHLTFIEGHILRGESIGDDSLPFMGTVAHDINSGNSVVSTHIDSIFTEVTKGSAAIPLIFQEVVLGQRLLVDIGVTDPLVFLTMLEMLNKNENSPANVCLVVAQEPGLYKNFFSEQWFKRSVGKSVKWLKETVFDSLVSAHLKLAAEKGYTAVELDADLSLDFSSNEIVKSLAKDNGRKQAKFLVDSLQLNK